MSVWSPAALRGPCFETLRPLLDAFETQASFPSLDELQQRWVGAQPALAGVRLVVDQKPRRRRQPPALGELYDCRVERGEIPTRADSWHDFFNVAAFVRFPHTKRTLHAQNAAALRREATSAGEPPRARSRFRDTRALLDEGGLLLAVARPAGAQARGWLALGQRGAPGGVAELRALAAQGALRPWVLGHALLEHAARSATGEALGAAPRALTWVVEVDRVEDVAAVDAAFAAELDAGALLEPPSYVGHALSDWFEGVASAQRVAAAGAVEPWR